MDGKFLESELALLASMANFFKSFEKSTPSPRGCGKRARACATTLLSGGRWDWARRAAGWDGGARTGAMTEDMDVAPVPCEQVARARLSDVHSD